MLFDWRRSAAVLCLGAGLVGAASAVQITQLSPQGEVARVRQVVANFDAAAIAFGSPNQPSPLRLDCDDSGATAGHGRWVNDRQWVFDFNDLLPPGVRCTVQVVPGFRTTEGQPLAGRQRFAFQTGGPLVRQSVPGDGATIEENPYFLLRFNGAVTPASVQANSHCVMDGLGERIAVRLVEGDEREQLLRARGWDAGRVPPEQVVALACRRQLTPAAQVQLVLGKGVATPGGVATRQAQRLSFTVREPFHVSFSCERENAQAACLPLRPMQLDFNTPVTRGLAQAIRLRPAGGGAAIAPEQADDGDADAVVDSVRFAPTLAENTAYTVELPKGFADASGRAPANAGLFPLKVATGLMPPLVKFAAAPFGVVERLADPDGAALMPVTVREIESATPARAAAGQVGVLRLDDDADIIAWYQRLAQFDRREVPRPLAARWARTPLPKVVDPDNRDWVDARMVGLLKGLPQLRTMALPQTVPGDPRPMEVVGIPLPAGFHVLEIASPRLGRSLLDERHGDARTQYVRSSALVTNLGVHFKLGQEGALAWVTTLDKGRPVARAAVKVSDCRGRVVAQGQTDASGVVRLDTVPARAPLCAVGEDGIDEEDGAGAWFVSARAAGADGVNDLAFTWSDWNRGIEGWRFDLPTGDATRPSLRAHTVLDRALLRAGERVSMKHFVRLESAAGLRLPAVTSAELVITHQGSGQAFRQPVRWRKTATGGLSASSEWNIPPAARLGVYTVELAQDLGRQGTEMVETAQFRVEEFRLPVLQGQLMSNDGQPLVAVTRAPVDLQVNHLSGGGAANLATQVSALLRPKALFFADHEGFSFEAPEDTGAAADTGEDEGDAGDGGPQKLVADKLPLVLDRNGRGRTTLEDLPAVRSPQQLLVEASYADPNGEIQTLRHVTTLWPAAVLAGIRTEGWVSTRQRARWQALALGIDGKPAAGVRLEVQATLRTTTSTRKRLVGGFYSYDNQTSTRDLGTVCSGRSDARGLLLCEAELRDAGEVQLTVTAQDSEGRRHQSVASVYVTRQGELWFGGEDHDRMDVLPEKKRYQPGETARLQVRMPFRFATALVSIEREGILETRVVQLRGEDPTIELKIEPGWGPNVYVSVLALRGRLREVPWYSFFSWGYKAPREWWQAFWHEGREYVAPTALVDLSKPAYRLGVAELQVGIAAHEIAVTVKTDRDTYAVRGQAQVNIEAKLPDGRPAAGAEVALAVVDQALLELGPNTSWDLLAGMWQRRGWSVETATAQMEIIGRRHYGRKAVPAGGGGGHSPTRELFDTLLLWNPAVVLDAQGRATVTVPLNDALTSFQVVAVADAGVGLFGTGRTQMRTTQDLQIISGLPPLVREGDRFIAQFSLRNTTPKAMQVAVTARATQLETPEQTLDLPAGETRELQWPVSVPEPLGLNRLPALLWEVQARDLGGSARDALKASQRVLPAVPVTVQQATLSRLEAPLTLPVAAPAGATADAQGALRGGIRMSLQPSLAEGLPAVRAWFADYPFTCLEQKASRAIGLGDAALWQALLAQLPVYLDGDGLAHYFPPREGDVAGGSDTLSAYLLAASHEASTLDPAWALPAEPRDAMLRGLDAFVKGQIERQGWSPRQDLTVRKLAAIEALSRHGKASARLLQSIEIAPNQWPTHALIDWLNILQRVADVPRRAERLQEVRQLLRSRLSWQGTKLVFSTEADDQWWWLMQNGDVNTARLLLAVMDDPEWKDDMGRLASGFIGRQQRGTWQTTTANLWGGLALQKFAARFESTPVSGSTRATLGTASAAVDWSRVVRADRQAPVAAGFATVGPATNAAGDAPGPWRNNSATLPWPRDSAPLSVVHSGSGQPWVTLQSLAAVDRKTPLWAGYQIRKTVTPVEQAVAGRFSRGDILRITLEVTASTDMSWVVLSDPVPGGASILGSGLGRDSAIATRGEQRSGDAWPVFEERSFEAYRAYYDHLGAGRFKAEYTVRLNSAGSFALPPTRIEAMYAPEVFGELPNARLTVEARP